MWSASGWLVLWVSTASCQWLEAARTSMPGTWIAPVDSFQVGGEEIKHTHLRIGDVGLDEIDMLLGADFFLSHRVYVANSQQMLYFTYNGGPVFDLRSTQQASLRSSEGPADAKPATEGPTDAEGFSRRGAALAGRGEYLSAIDDFSHAMALAPHYFSKPMVASRRAPGSSVGCFVLWTGLTVAIPLALGEQHTMLVSASLKVLSRHSVAGPPHPGPAGCC